LIALEVLGADLDLDEEVVNAEGVKHGATRAVIGGACVGEDY